MTFATKAFATLFGITLAAFAIDGCNDRQRARQAEALLSQQRQVALQKLSGKAKPAEPDSPTMGLEGELSLTRNDVLKAYVGTLVDDSGVKHRVQLPYDRAGNFESMLNHGCAPSASSWCAADVTASPIPREDAWKISQIYALEQRGYMSAPAVTSTSSTASTRRTRRPPASAPVLPESVRVKAKVLVSEKMPDGTYHIGVKYTDVPGQGLPIEEGLLDHFGINDETDVSRRQMNRLEGVCSKHEAVVKGGCTIDVTLERGSDNMYDWAVNVHDVNKPRKK